MNFKSLSMLPLTSISRLEHTIGLAYLAQLFALNNKLGTSFSNDLLIAALYHDVNCGSFGHSVEWAINRYTRFDHEEEAVWLSKADFHPYFRNLPRFIEMPGIRDFKFGNKYEPDFKRVYQIIKGESTFVINNKGIDLDNIDNVFRMAYYLGIAPKETAMPVNLVESLMIKKGIDNFVIKKEKANLINVWHRLRSTVYHKFIYSKEYMAFEHLVFRLVCEFSKNVDKDGVSNLFHFTDESLVWNFTDKKNYSKSVNEIAKKILLHDLPYSYAILRSKDLDKKESLINDNINKFLSDELSCFLRNKKKSKNIPEIYFHLTTDNRKTGRKINFYVDDGKTICQESVGEDNNFILLCILGKSALSKELITLLIDKAIEILQIKNLGTFEFVPFADQELNSGKLF